MQFEVFESVKVFLQTSKGVQLEVLQELAGGFLVSFKGMMLKVSGEMNKL